MMFEEFEEVFTSLFESADQYKEIITIIASHKDGISRTLIEEKNKYTGAGGRLSKRIEDLEHAGFIASYIPFGRKKLGLYYRINDEYCYFYLKWIASLKTQLKRGVISKYWQNSINTPEYYGWLGYSFENICFKHVVNIKKALNIEESALASSWRYISEKNTKEQGAQIDLLFDREDDSITLCEIKYTEQPFIIDKQYAQILSQKIKVFQEVTKTKKQIFLALISANGVKQNSYSEALVNKVVTLKDLVL